MDLRNAVTEALEKSITEGVVKDAIEQALQKTVNEIVKSTLSTYSEFGKAITEAVKKSLAFQADELDLTSYNDTILKVVRRQVDAGVNNLLEREVAEHLEDLLQAPPAEVKLSQLVEQYRTYVEELAADSCSCHGEAQRIAMHVEHSDSQGFWYLHLNPTRKNALGEVLRDRDYAYRLGVHNERVFSLYFDRADTEKKLFIGRVRAFERTLLQLKAAGTRLIDDRDEVGEINLYYGEGYHD